MNRGVRKQGPSKYPLAIRVVSYRRPQPGVTAASPTSSETIPSRLLSSARQPNRRGSSVAWLPLQENAKVTPERLAITLPPPPSINHQYATLNGRRILSAAGRVFKQTVTREVLVALARSPHRNAFRRAAQDTPLSLAIHFFFVSPLRRDVDGGLKIAQDALCEALEINDNRIHEIHLYKKQDASRPRIEVTLSPLSSSHSNG